jgi:hypothetical protein
MRVIRVDLQVWRIATQLARGDNGRLRVINSTNVIAN